MKDQVRRGKSSQTQHSLRDDTTPLAIHPDFHLFRQLKPSYWATSVTFVPFWFGVKQNLYAVRVPCHTPPVQSLLQRWNFPFPPPDVRHVTLSLRSNDEEVSISWRSSSLTDRSEKK